MEPAEVEEEEVSAIDGNKLDGDTVIDAKIWKE